jgi:hypothetical protein
MSSHPATADAKLKTLQAAILQTMSETLQALVNRPVVMRTGRRFTCDPAAILARLKSPAAAMRATLDQDDQGRTLRVLLDLRDAAVLAGAMLLAPEAKIEARRALGKLEGEDLEVFAEVGNVLCSGIDGVLRKLGLQSGARLQDHGVVTPGADEAGRLGKEPLVACMFQIAVGTYPESEGMLLLEPATAERWSGGPLALAALTPDAPAASASGAFSAVGEAGEDDIPQAPIRGKLAAYLVESDTLPVVRRSCRRVGLELDRRSRTDIPNPGAHRDHIVLIEVGPSEDRKFDWCKRLKHYHESIRVILLLHHPSRQRVVQGFMVKADAIVGHPVTEPVLSAKLAAQLVAIKEPAS